jgi:hypothetical protein
MTVQLTIVQLWALVAGGPVAMILTVLVGILVNNAVTAAKFDKMEGVLKAEIKRLEREVQRVEGILSVKLDTLSARVKALEDEVHSPLVKRG